MNVEISEFCTYYKNKKINDKDIEENKLHPTDDTRDRITFGLSVHISCPMVFVPNRKTLFKIDDEDLEYLYNKYSKKIDEEMNKNLDDVRRFYGK